MLAGVHGLSCLRLLDKSRRRRLIMQRGQTSANVFVIPGVAKYRQTERGEDDGNRDAYNETTSDHAGAKSPTIGHRDDKQSEGTQQLRRIHPPTRLPRLRLDARSVFFPLRKSDNPPSYSILSLIGYHNSPSPISHTFAGLMSTC